jgi:hypothetical protein
VFLDLSSSSVYNASRFVVFLDLSSSSVCNASRFVVFPVLLYKNSVVALGGECIITFLYSRRPANAGCVHSNYFSEAASGPRANALCVNMVLGDVDDILLYWKNHLISML